MDTINNDIKEQRFRFPGQDFVGFGRRLSCVTQGGALWTAAQKEDADGITLVIARTGNGETERIELPVGPLYHRPSLVAGKGQAPSVVWNEFTDETWSIKFAPLSDGPLSIGKIETVFSSLRLCQPPTGVYCGDAAHIAWPAVIDDRVRILTAVKQDGNWKVDEPISGSDVDALRPCMCVAGNSVHLFWDQYKESRYEVAGARQTGSEWEAVRPAGHPDERWFCPNVAATSAGDVYLTWVVMQEVSDDLGITEHIPFAMVGKVDGNRIEVIEDQNGRAIADMREGLLPSKISKGYLGLRRNPQLSVDACDRLWCCWEVRVEAESTAVSGYLAARSFDGAAWSEARLLANPGYGYALPEKQAGQELSFGYFKFAETGLDIIAVGATPTDVGRPFAPDASKWTRWHGFDIEPLVKPERTVEVDGTTHAMFWADTHCHSNVSADAEGEPDEIIHYARDIAGLDVLCVIDNDFYPNKTFSPAEWQVRQEESRYFTKKDEFVLFPGYEFTYHRKDLKPDFNHRCVMYPRPGGKMHRRIDAATDSDYKLLAALDSTNVICYPHHSTYELINPSVEWNIEACSSWRTVLEECDFTIGQLREGKKLGFIGSSDAHRANPGLGGALTGLFAPELTPEALFDAYKNRRIIATQGFAVFIDFRVAGLFIGSEGTSVGAPEITAEIEAPKEIEYVRVLRDGKEIHRETSGGDTCSLSFTDETVGEGKHFYFLNLKLVGEPGYNTDPAENSRAPFSVKSKYPHNLARARGVFAWTSPVWIDVQG